MHWPAVMQPYIQKASMYCVIWSIPSFTLIKAIYKLCHNNASVGLYLVGKTVLICHVDKSWPANALSIVGIFFFSNYYPWWYTISSHHPGCRKHWRSCHATSFLLSWSQVNPTTYIMALDILIQPWIKGMTTCFSLSILLPTWSMWPRSC